MIRREHFYYTLAVAIGFALGVIALGSLDHRSAPADAAGVNLPAQLPMAKAETQAPILGKAVLAAADGQPQQRPPLEAEPAGARPQTELKQQIGALLANWGEMEQQLERLRQRVRALEQETARAQAETAPKTSGETANPVPADTPEQRRAALVEAGIPLLEAEEIVWRQAEIDMNRLELQDRAIREGWFRSDRYFAELRQLNKDRLDLRAEIGDEAYDRYLFGTGQANRVQVSSVIPGSPAEQIGLLPGDVIESYGGERLFSFSDLRNATTQGERDEQVAIQIRRGGGLVETWIPRGPMGVRLDTSLNSPDS